MFGVQVQAITLRPAEGMNAEEAQMKLYQAAKSAGKTSCWPVWQGRVAGS